MDTCAGPKHSYHKPDSSLAATSQRRLHQLYPIFFFHFSDFLRSLVKLQGHPSSWWLLVLLSLIFNPTEREGADICINRCVYERDGLEHCFISKPVAKSANIVCENGFTQQLASPTSHQLDPLDLLVQQPLNWGQLAFQAPEFEQFEGSRRCRSSETVTPCQPHVPTCSHW